MLFFITMKTYLNGRLVVFPTFYDDVFCDKVFRRLSTQIKWLDKTYTNEDGSIVHLPRLTANYGEKSYNYSGMVFEPEPWTDTMLELKRDAEILAQETFNAAVLQFYRDGRDKVNWHSDDDMCVGQNPTIASISLGETREFWFKAKNGIGNMLKLTVKKGDVIIMQGTLQHTHLHKVPAEMDKTGRINLTFRKVLS